MTTRNGSLARGLKIGCVPFWVLGLLCSLGLPACYGAPQSGDGPAAPGTGDGEEPGTGGSSAQCIGAALCPLPEPVGVNQVFGHYSGRGRHLAADLAASAGTTATAACDGPVVYLGDHRGYGSARDYQRRGPVTIQQCSLGGTSATILYGHCRSLVAAGTGVGAGAPVCQLSFYEGVDAGTDWSHLHFGINLATFSIDRLGVFLQGYAPDGEGWAGAWVDPLRWTPASGGNKGGGAPHSCPSGYRCSDYKFQAGQCYMAWECDCGGECLTYSSCGSDKSCGSQKTGCSGFIACFNLCQDQACANQCLSNTTTEGARLELALVNCLGGACPRTGGGDCDSARPGYSKSACQSCFVAAQNPGGTCSLQLAACAAN